MTLVAVALAGCLYGMAHGLGPDHLAALATLLVGGDRRRTVIACVRFGVGHALVLGVLGAAAALCGWLVPEVWEQAAEAAGGALLVLLGGVALARALRVVVHRHEHVHEEAGPGPHGHGHAHWHVHVGDARRHRHGHRHAALVGGLLALSGVRALALVISPLVLAGRSAAQALAFLCAFGLGVTLSMIVFGLLFQAGRRVLGRGARDLGAVGVGGVSLLLGMWWIWSSLV